MFDMVKAGLPEGAFAVGLVPAAAAAALAAALHTGYQPFYKMLLYAYIAQGCDRPLGFLMRRS